VDGLDSDVICAGWAHKIYELLTKQKEAFQRADFMRSKLRLILTWESVAKQLSIELCRLVDTKHDGNIH
jgi:hypothetical protein